MPMPERVAEWEDLSRRLRQFCLQEYHYEPLAITFEGPSPVLRHTHALVVPIPVQPLRPPEPSGDNPPVRPRWDGGPGPGHLSDFQKVYWPPLGTFTFQPRQRPAVKLLWEAWEDGTDEVSQQTLLRASESQCVKLVDLFKGSDAWGKLIISAGGGYYRLAPLPSPEKPDPASVRTTGPLDPDE